MNFFNQGIPLGRWFGIAVVIHWTFLLYAAMRLFGGDSTEQGWILLHAIFLALLFATVLLHELGHALSCKAVGGQANHIVLWPLGGIAFVQPPMHPAAWLVTTICGPLVNAILWPVFYFVSKALVIHQYGALDWYHMLSLMEKHQGTVTFVDVSLPIQVCLYMWQINKMLLLFNLIPAYPMDGGRILQEALWVAGGYARSLKIAGMVGTVAGAGFIFIGLGLRNIDIPAIGFHLGQQGEPSAILCIIGLLCAIQSFLTYQRAQQLSAAQKV